MTAPMPKTAVNFAVPPGACDCHVHVVGDPARYPMVAGRVYTPPPAPAEELSRLLQSLHLDRVVIIQPSFYGTDNSATLDGMHALGPKRARGVAVIDERTPAAALKAMADAGMRGLRLNLETAGETDPVASLRKLQAGIAWAQPLGWHVQIYARLSLIAALADDIARSPVTLVFDHFAGATAALGLEQAGFAAVLALIRAGKAYCKISGAYRVSERGPDYGDAAPLAKALIAANSERILWGTDWPHSDSSRPPGRAATDVTPYQPIDDGRLLNELPAWSPDAAIRHKILVDNPARLYGF
jgi:predicted TIM-barrel fold metal-dependent hydrolase